MNRNVAMVIILGVVAIAIVIGMSPWIIEGPRRWLRGQWLRFHKPQAEKA